jgi:Ca2+-transporting ATPase
MTTAIDSATLWHTLTAEAAATALDCDPEQGLDAALRQQRLAEFGPNEIPRDRPPSPLQVALGQLRDPMTLMLVAVAVVSFLIAQASTGWVVASLVVLNVVLGTNQELKAQASVAALAGLQVPSARLVVAGQVREVPAADLVPGDVVAVEAGDLVPADGRLVGAASLETQEAALTGESAPVGKAVAAVTDPEASLGDRTSMLYQNTSVTRGSGRILVTATGAGTEVGRIAGMLGGVSRTRSPLQRELDDITRKVGWVAWGALAVILVVGLVRGLPFADLMLLGTSMAISAIPTGMPTFVQSLLAYGARQLAAEKAIVRNLADVETLGATSQVNTDKTGTLTLNQMTARRVFAAGTWFSVTGEGYATAGDVRRVAGTVEPDLTALAYVAALASDAVVTEDGAVVGDPTELAVVVLAEKLGVAVDLTRRTYPRLATVPFDSDYKFMATFHRLPFEGRPQVLGLVKGGTDVVLDRCAQAWAEGGARVPLADCREQIEAANHELAANGLRVLALAARVVPDDQQAALEQDPMAFTTDLLFLGLVGIIDPLRPEAVEAVRVARGAGIDVRMITGDHLVTARAIGTQLGLGAGGMTGAEFAAASDEELLEQLPDLHVFGRVSPQDKLRLVQLMQRQGHVVAMTGDAVNDAAALKAADIGVAMGSGSEVSKQAARMILTDDNFATLVRAIALGRSVFAKITAYLSYQMTQLFGLVAMFLIATAVNLNEGVAMLPLQVLFLNFLIAVLPVIIIAMDPAAADAMSRPPRDPSARIMNRTNTVRWLLYGLLLAVCSIGAILLAPGQPRIDAPSVPVTMGFVVMGLGTAVSGFVLHRNPGSAFARPVLRPAALTLASLVLLVFATELGFLQRWVRTVSLTGGQWLTCLALAAGFGAVIELDKLVQRRRAARPGAVRRSAV